MIARILIAFVSLYRRVVSPLFPQSCRFHPSCSEFALQALQTHGAARGTLLALRRIGRCQPWSAGGLDPVPPRREAPPPGRLSH